MGISAIEPSQQNGAGTALGRFHASTAALGNESGGTMKAPPPCPPPRSLGHPGARHVSFQLEHCASGFPIRISLCRLQHVELGAADGIGNVDVSDF